MEQGKTEMPPILVDYIVAKVVQDIRSGVDLSEELAIELNKYPLVDALRRAIKPDDIDRVIHLSNSLSTQVGDLAIGLLTQYTTMKKVKDFLLRAWGETKSFDRKHAIMYRLLDHPDLEHETKKEIRTFVDGNLPQFLAKATNWYGGREYVLDACRSRLANKNLTPGKAWVYFIECVELSPDKAAVANLLRDYLSSPSRDDFSAGVAREMLRKISG